jgi:hypothetical protein
MVPRQTFLAICGGTERRDANVSLCQVIKDLAQRGCVQVLFIQKSNGAGFEAPPMELSIRVGADQYDA